MTSKVYTRIADHNCNGHHKHCKPSALKHYCRQQSYSPYRCRVSRHRAVEVACMIAICEELQPISRVHRAWTRRERWQQIGKDTLMLKDARHHICHTYSNANSHSKGYQSAPRIASPHHIYNKKIQRQPHCNA